MTYEGLKKALAIFGLGERATLRQIKARHRKLVKAHHPDHGSSRDPAAIARINAAHAILMDYCENYRFSFSEEEFLEQRPEERIKRQFGWDPVWSGKQEGSDG
jgi:DnaJ-class molecular chaperone